MGTLTGEHSLPARLVAASGNVPDGVLDAARLHFLFHHVTSYTAWDLTVSASKSVVKALCHEG